MKKFYKKSLYMLVAGALVASCADYNDMNNFTAEPDPSFILPYAEYKPIKSYIDRDANPNLEIGATLDITEFNKQELSHAAVMTNFDNVSFGKSLMSGTIINNKKGIMNFINMMDLLDHMEEIGGSVFGSPLVANANQCDDWLNLLTAPIEITVDFVPGKAVDFNVYNVGDMPCTNKKTSASQLAKIANVKGESYKALNVPSQAKVNIIEGFEVDPKATYTTTFWAIADKDASFELLPIDISQRTACDNRPGDVKAVVTNKSLMGFELIDDTITLNVTGAVTATNQYVYNKKLSGRKNLKCDDELSYNPLIYNPFPQFFAKDTFLSKLYDCKYIRLNSLLPR